MFCFTTRSTHLTHLSASNRIIGAAATVRYTKLSILDQLGIATLKRLGDGFYEQQLVADQLRSLTGSAHTDGYALLASASRDTLARQNAGRHGSQG